MKLLELLGDLGNFREVTKHVVSLVILAAADNGLLHQLNIPKNLFFLV